MRRRIAAQCESEQARLVELHRAEQIDDTHAQLQFEIANCLREQGHYELAGRRYRLASDLDQIPVGAPSSYKEVIERVAEETGSLYLDVELTIDAEAERVSDGLVGFDFVIDAMHPTLLRLAKLQLRGKAKGP